MGLDVFTVSVLTALVVLSSGTLFLLETFLRRDEAVGRIWALSFLAAMLTSVAYMVWALDPSAVWPIALGNAAFVTSAGCMWLGCRRFNERSILIPGSAVAGGAVVTFAAALLDAANGDWAGAVVMFVLISAFAGLGSGESFTGAMRRHRNAIGLALILAAECVYYLARTGVFLIQGPDSELFQTWFSTVSTSLVTVVLSIVALLTTSILRAGLAGIRGVRSASDLQRTEDGVLRAGSFATLFADLVRRADARGETVGVVSVRVDDLPQITTAFGRGEAEAVATAWRQATRRAAPTQSFVGEDGNGGLAVALVLSSASEARYIATAVRDAVFDGVREAPLSILPIVTVGTAVSSRRGITTADLIAVARATAGETGTDVVDVDDVTPSGTGR